MWRVLTAAVLATGALAAAVKKPATTRSTEFRNIQQIVQAVPAEVYPKDVDHWTDLKMAEANEHLEREVKGHPGSFAFKVSDVHPDHQSEGDYVVASGPLKFGQQVYWYWSRFDEDQKAALSKLQPGDVILVFGNIYQPKFERRNDFQGHVCLEIGMNHCTLTRPRK